MKPLCPLCGSRHESYQAHLFATNAATNTKDHATNAQLGSGAPQPEISVAEERGYAPAKTPNRRGREAYNAYQREYVKVWRAVKSGRACWLA